MSEMTSNDEIEPCLTAVMPVYNEAATVAEVVRVVLAQRPVQELVIVDDYSTDGTCELLQLSATNEPRIMLLRHDINQGKGAALRTGISRATSKIIVIQDADLEYDPADWKRMYNLIAMRKVADVVYGSRFFGLPHRSLFYHHYVANKLISVLFNSLYNQTISDVEVCY